MPGRLQEDCRRDWAARGRIVTERAGALRGVPPERLERPRSDGGWSAAQVLEHLVMTSESYLAVMRQRVETGTYTPGRADPVWRPRFGGALLVRSIQNPRKLPAPAAFRPGPEARPHVVDAFIEEMRELDALLARAQRLPWNQIRFGSPVLPLLRLNFGDGCAILIAHAERHLGQIDRVLAESAGPAA